MQLCISYRPSERRIEHEGSLILGICTDIHSILTYMIAAQTHTDGNKEKIEYTTFRSLSGRVKLPDVKIPTKNISTSFEDAEDQWLDTYVKNVAKNTPIRKVLMCFDS